MNWGAKNVVDYYTENRNSISKLYESEKKLINKIEKKKIFKILDFGCAAGSFCEIFLQRFKKATYTGLDKEKKLILFAKNKFSCERKANFLLHKGQRIQIKKNKFELTFCTSVLHHIKNYKLIIKDLIKISNKYIFIDSPRVHFQKDKVAIMNLSNRFKSKGKVNNVKYYIVNIKKYLKYLKSEFKINNINLVYFYCDNLPYSRKYINLKKKIIFLTILMIKEKGRKKNFKYKLFTKNKKIKKIFRKTFAK